MSVGEGSAAIQHELVFGCRSKVYRKKTVADFLMHHNVSTSNGRGIAVDGRRTFRDIQHMLLSI
jgi:hypothetical protein